MATNRSMIQALERIAELIDNLNNETEKLINLPNSLHLMLKELKAWKRVLYEHIIAQKKQPGQDWNDHYEYDEKTNRCERVYE